jgi:PAS domain S-box-containing protein
MKTDNGKRGNSGEALSVQATQQLLHDLQVHQVELELQNEELRRTQLALDAERARYFDLYDMAPVGYCTLSEQGLILEANLTAANLLGVARSELIKQPFSRFIQDESQDSYYLHRKRLFDTGLTQSCELPMVAQDGSGFWAHLEATIAQNADGVALHRAVLTDISDRIHLDQALQEKNLELEGARAAADKANRAKSEFLSNMSHELRSPLNAILGFAQLMESGSPPPTLTQKARIDHILQAGWYLLELINEILDLALIESGRMALSLEPLSLTDVLSDCASMIGPLAEQNGIQVRFAQLEHPFVVHADRTRLTQLVVNLLSNAIKYNRVGGTVDVTLGLAAPARLRIRVRDSGHGLSAERLAQLFEPFNRLGQENSAIEGTGIGLVVCKRLVEMMGGAIGVESSVGVGSVFWIELNLSDTPVLAVAAEESIAPAQMPLLQGGGLHTLLYVEDNRANLELVAQMLAPRADLHLLCASDGAQGIALARSQHPDVILLDINLPGISGLEVLRILRQDPATRSIPVLAISANAMPGDIEKGLAAGFLRYLTKPFKVKELMQTLDLALEVARVES